MEIKDRWSLKIIFKSKKNTMREAVLEAIEQNADLSSANLSSANLSSADLSSADLSSADLSSANLRYADLSSANLRYANLRYANLSSVDLRYANLSSADLRYANLSSVDLRYANLRSADLRYADLRYANLKEIKNYSESHEVFFELVRIEKISNFKKSEWEIIGQLAIHYPRWNTIIKRFAKTPLTRIFKTLADKGFGEYLEKYKKEIKEVS